MERFANEAAGDPARPVRPLRWYPARVAHPAPPTRLTPSGAVYLGREGPFGGTDDDAVTAPTSPPAQPSPQPRPVDPLPPPPAPAPAAVPVPPAPPAAAPPPEPRARWWQRLTARLRRRS